MICLTLRAAPLYRYGRPAPCDGERPAWWHIRSRWIDAHGKIPRVADAGDRDRTLCAPLTLRPIDGLANTIVVEYDSSATNNVSPELYPAQAWRVRCRSFSRLDESLAIGRALQNIRISRVTNSPCCQGKRNLRMHTNRLSNAAGLSVAPGPTSTNALSIRSITRGANAYIAVRGPILLE